VVHHDHVRAHGGKGFANPFLPLDEHHVRAHAGKGAK
jgi:hypothetical protein